MQEILSFIRECGAFFVLTVNRDFPAGRPFGAIAEIDGKLCIATTDEKAVYCQLKENPNLQLLAMKPGTRSWLRVSGRAGECFDISIKQHMLDACPVLYKHYASADAPHYRLFCIDVLDYEFK